MSTLIYRVFVVRITDAHYVENPILVLSSLFYLVSYYVSPFILLPLEASALTLKLSIS